MFFRKVAVVENYRKFSKNELLIPNVKFSKREGMVLVNEEIEIQRGQKLFPDRRIKFVQFCWEKRGDLKNIKVGLRY